MTATLVYLAAQVRQSNRMQRAESIRSFLVEYNATARSALDPTMGEVVRRGFQDFDRMPKREQGLVHPSATTHVMLAQISHILDREEMVDPLISNLIMGFNAVVLSTPDFAQWW